MKKIIDIKRTKLHYMSEGSYGNNKKAEILLDNVKIAEASTDVAFDKENKKTAFDILAEKLDEKIKVNWYGLDAIMIHKAICWAAANSLDCQVFIG